jgi:glyceraldehyde-3-phosphate dehydrogenase/erythrose-4-phosphate dehydrogenase
VLAFYDNEWGYANRMVDIVKLVASRRSPESLTGKSR